MLIDYTYFGDVISMDTTYSTNRNNIPLAIFLGFNHYKGLVIFGAALLYDETTESFKWLLETFLEAHKQRRPYTVFSDQDAAMARALREVMPDTKHRLCTWHLMENGIKHLSNLMNDDGTRFLTGFRKCVYEYKDEMQFEEEWRHLISTYGVEKNNWVSSIYKVKEKWAWCYMKHAFTLGVRSTQLSERANSDIKRCTRPGLDINQFVIHFERVLEKKRYHEYEHEFNARDKNPILIMQSSPMLQQLVQIYTTPAFAMFQEQFDLHGAACAIERKVNESSDKILRATREFIVTMIEENGEWIVTFNPIDLSISCSCRMFETVGILCGHAIHVYDMNNVKFLPEKYILKRWTKQARSGVVHDIRGKEIQIDPNLEATHRYMQMSPRMNRLVSEASTNSQAFAVLNNIMLESEKQVGEILVSERKDGDTNTTLSEPVAQPKGFKKKDGVKRSTRPRSWVEKLCLKKRTPSQPSSKQSQQPMESQRKRRKKTSQPPSTQTQQPMESQRKRRRKKTSQPLSTETQQPPLTQTQQTFVPQEDQLHNTYSNLSQGTTLTFTSMLMAPLDCSLPSLEAIEFCSDISQGATSSSNITASSSFNGYNIQSPNVFTNYHQKN